MDRTRFRCTGFCTLDGAEEEVILFSELPNVEVTFAGTPIKVGVLVFGRDKNNSPKSIYYKYEGRLISPYEMRRRNWGGLPLWAFAKLVYGPRKYGFITAVFFAENEILKDIPFLKVDR
jgi:hypothetical protein